LLVPRTGMIFFSTKNRDDFTRTKNRDDFCQNQEKGWF
jgi:hypothetical protein